ncbi:hypothetical protein [Dactylosporangium sp. CA-092794]|uniref:hypothetical protein n=1 Tax=Dactylosporangium sp. CA-092794 TaxID=3239929 RepID=UPI003D8BD7C6
MPVQRLLWVAALIGPSCGLQDVARLMQCPPAALTPDLAEAIRARVLVTVVEQGNDNHLLMFASDDLHQGVCNSLPCPALPCPALPCPALEALSSELDGRPLSWAAYGRRRWWRDAP